MKRYDMTVYSGDLPRIAELEAEVEKRTTEVENSPTGGR